MEEAYEIGIRLVLENGVSAGIAALQDDLTAYDRALAATTGRLQAATEGGRRLTAPVNSDQAVPVVHAPVGEAPSEVPDAARGRRREAPTTVAEMSPRVSVPRQPAAVSAPTPLQATPPERVSKAPKQALRVPVAPEQPVRAMAPAQQSLSSQAREPVRAVTVMATPSPSYARYAPPSPVCQAPAIVVPEVPDNRPAPMPIPDRRESQQAPLAPREPVRTSAWNVTPPSAGLASADTQAAPRPMSAPVAATMAPSPAPAASQPSQGPAQGDVFLDGARVGRWMSDRMTREVDRPQAGVTGFDPRLGPAWPGSLHGT